MTGDAAHGGLSASAGTPYGKQLTLLFIIIVILIIHFSFLHITGQRAGAGLGGTVDNGNELRMKT